MAITISGVDKLISKLDKLSRIESKKVIEDVGTIVEKSIRDKARSFSKEEYKYIGKCEARDYKNSYYLDIGLSNDKVDFELWKGLWYHNWGYWNNGWNFKGTMYISIHQMWFDEAIQAIAPKAKKEIKSRIKAEIKAFK